MAADGAHPDPLVDGFAEFAAAVIPAFAVADRDGAQVALPRAARNHPAVQSVVDALGQDAALARLLEPDGFEVSTGLGYGGATPGWLLDEFLLATWRRLDISGATGRRRRVAAAARSIVNDARRLARGEVVDVPAWML